VVPLSTQVDRLYPSHAYVTLNGRQHKAMADQFATASKLRLKGKVGALNAPDMAAVERVVRVQLGL
jgi:mRNA interferase MazF